MAHRKYAATTTKGAVSIRRNRCCLNTIMYCTVAMRPVDREPERPELQIEKKPDRQCQEQQISSANETEEGRREEKEEEEAELVCRPIIQQEDISNELERGAVGISDLEPSPADARDRLVQVLVLRRTTLNVIAEKGIARASVVEKCLDAEDRQKTAENPHRRAPARLPKDRQQRPAAQERDQEQETAPVRQIGAGGRRSLTERKAPRLRQREASTSSSKATDEKRPSCTSDSIRVPLMTSRG